MQSWFWLTAFIHLQHENNYRTSGETTSGLEEGRTCKLSLKSRQRVCCERQQVSLLSVGISLINCWLLFI